jgi:hypothetical protein
MNPLSTALFSMLFIAVAMVLGNLYDKINISRTFMLVITAVIAVIFVANLIREKIFLKKKDESE